MNKTNQTKSNNNKEDFKSKISDKKTEDAAKTSASSGSSNSDGKGAESVIADLKHSKDLGGAKGDSVKGKKPDNQNKGKTKPNSKKPSGKKFNNRNDSATKSEEGAASTVEDKKYGAKASSTNFLRDESKINGTTNSTQQTSSPSLSVKGFRNYSISGDGLTSFENFNNSELDVKALNAEAVELGRTREQKRRADKLKAIRTERLVVIPRTTGPSYRTELFEENTPTNKTMLRSVKTDNDRDLNIAIMPQVITVVLSMNISRYNNKLLKVFRDNIKLETSTFSSSEMATEGLMWYQKAADAEDGYIKVESDPLASFNKIQKVSETKRGYIASFIPNLSKESRTLLKLERKLFYNKINKTSTEWGATPEIDEGYSMDVGTWSTTLSNNNFLSNLENAVQNDEKWVKFAGLTRNKEVLLHLLHAIVQFNTLLMLIFRSLTHSANSAGFLTKKLGYLDTTYKHLATSVVSAGVHSSLKEWAAWMSLMPYNKKVVDMFEKYGEWGMLGNDDSMSELNPLVVPAFVVVGDFVKNSELNNYIPFRDNAAATSVVINTDNPLAFFVDSIVKFFDYKPAETQSKNFSVTNQPMYSDALFSKSDNWVYQAESIVISKHRITSWVYNAVMTMTRVHDLKHAFNDYFRRISQFLEIFKIPGVLDGTDWEVSQVEIPPFIFAEINEPGRFQHDEWFSGMHLLTEYSKIQLLPEDYLQLGSYIPGNFLYPSLGEEKAKYDNLISFLWVDSAPEDYKFEAQYYSGYDFLYPWFKINTSIISANLYDATIMPFIPYAYSIQLGWNYGTIAKGETYQFTTGKDEYLQFYPMMFEWTKAYSPAMWEINKESSFPVLTNNDHVGYYVSQDLIPGLTMTKNRSGMIYALYSNKDWNRLPYNLWKYKSDKFHGLGFNPNKPSWRVFVTQLFRTRLFKGMSPLAFGVSYDDIPSLEQCVFEEE